MRYKAVSGDFDTWFKFAVEDTKTGKIINKCNKMEVAEKMAQTLNEKAT